jgi:hypothetical protein
MTHLTNEGIKEDMRKRGIEGDLDNIDPGCFTAEDLRKSIQEDVEILRSSTHLKGAQIRGFVLTTETGLLEEI